MQQPDRGRKVHPFEDFEAELLQMKRADRLRLIAIGRSMSGSTGMTGEDLLQEAICRVYEERRTWTDGLSVLQFIVGAMSSIADGSRKQWCRSTRFAGVSATETSPANLEGLLDPKGVLAEVHQTAPSPEAVLQRSEEMRLCSERMQALFHDDEEGHLMLLGMMDGSKGDELRLASGVSPDRFASKYRKVQRRLQALQSKGSKK